MQHNINMEGIMVKTTNGVAVAGIFSPAWLPSLGDASNIAAQLVPIFSLFWLILQILRSFSAKDKRKGHSDEKCER